MIDLSKTVNQGVFRAERRNFREKLSLRREYLRLDLNENLIRLEAGELADMLSTIDSNTLSAYPDLSRIYRQMSQYVGAAEDEIVLTNGSDMGIKTIFDICIDKGDHIVVHAPFFMMYEHYARFSEASIDAVPVNADWRPDVELMLAKVNKNTKMVVVECPSGNLGTSLTLAETEHMATALAEKNVFLVIDEAYLACEKDRSDNLPLIHKYRNIILVRTMSKAHGLAGARLGVLVSTREISRELYKVRSLYEISALTATVAEWHLNHPEVLTRYRDAVRLGKRYLQQECRRLGIGFKDTPANFVILEVDPANPTDEYAARLKEKGILIGMPYSLPHLYGWARVTVGDLSQCKRFIGAVEELRNKQELAC